MGAMFEKLAKEGEKIIIGDDGDNPFVSHRKITVMEKLVVWVENRESDS